MGSGAFLIIGNQNIPELFLFRLVQWQEPINKIHSPSSIRKYQ